MKLSIFMTMVVTAGLGGVSAFGGASAGSGGEGKCPITGTTEDFLCDGIHYYISVPEHPCVASNSCGLVVFLHGATNTKDVMDANTDMIAKAGKEGYAVVIPQAPMRDHFKAMGWPAMPSWVPSQDYDSLEAFIRQAVDDMPVDPKKVHVTGYSQGGYGSYSMLCRASDVVCSAAPLGAAQSNNGWFALFGGEGAMPTEFQDFDESACFDASGPDVKRPILVMTGTNDFITPLAGVDATVDEIRAVYGTGGTVEYTTFDFMAPDAPEGGVSVKGHCFPVTQEECEAQTTKATAAGANSVCCGDFSYTDKVLEFFKANPCT